MNESRFWKYLTQEEDSDFLNTMDEVNELANDTQELLQEYSDGNEDKSKVIDTINEIRSKLDEIEDNL